MGGTTLIPSAGFFKALVSTIIPVYNRPELLREAVGSVLAQTYRPIEVILVDDGSTDDTPAVLDKMAAEHFDIIKVIHKENGGPGLAREAGRQIARGEFIQYLDSDDWLLPRKFELQVKALREHPECEIAYCRSKYVNEHSGETTEPSKETGIKREYLFPALLVDRWWHTHTPLFRRSISDAAGAWPKRRPEDWDLEARMGALKPKLVYCDATLSCQRGYRDPTRVSWGSQEAYLLDEAWFLPRLYQCAVKAGVTLDAPEMRHFSRWAFMRARDLGAMGEADKAWEMLDLAKKSSVSAARDMKFVAVTARLIGWRLTGKLCKAYERKKK